MVVPITGAGIRCPVPWSDWTRKYTQKMKPITNKMASAIHPTTGMKLRMTITIERPPKMISDCDAFHFTSGSSLPTNRNIKPPSQPRTYERIVYILLLLAAAPAPLIGAGCPGGGGGICDMETLL